MLGLSAQTDASLRIRIFSLDVHSTQIGHLPQGLAAGQTGDTRIMIDFALTHRVINLNSVALSQRKLMNAQRAILYQRDKSRWSSPRENGKKSIHI